MNRVTFTLILSFLMLLGCTSARVTAEELAAQKAIYDRETKSIIDNEGASRVDHGLAQISSEDLSKSGYVRMVAWKGGQAVRDYYSAPGKLDTLDSKYLTWVTKASQLEAMMAKLKLHKKSGQALALRLEQLLGLPPAADTTRAFLVLHVKPEDLFRPCRDPEVNDCECIPNFPEGAYSPENVSYQPIYEGIIGATQGFPWTRMGYTFDWNSKNPTHFGMSEYVIRQGAVVEIVSKTPTEAWIPR
ncbi:MAG: hypothetical protein IPP17_07515 [Bacteroidetes bacterium]|nr:hypothetical protein [Bacteroidota bacterium]